MPSAFRHVMQYRPRYSAVPIRTWYRVATRMNTETMPLIIAGMSFSQGRGVSVSSPMLLSPQTTDTSNDANANQVRHLQSRARSSAYLLSRDSASSSVIFMACNRVVPKPPSVVTSTSPISHAVLLRSSCALLRRSFALVSALASVSPNAHAVLLLFSCAQQRKSFASCDCFQRCRPFQRQSELRLRGAVRQQAASVPSSTAVPRRTDFPFVVSPSVDDDSISPRQLLFVCPCLAKYT